jgi:hypothetical protein
MNFRNSKELVGETWKHLRIQTLYKHCKATFHKNYSLQLTTI